MVDEFDVRVKELARLMGVPWPLHAADIPVGEVSFASAHPSLEDEPVFVPATGSNLKSRLFISYLLDGRPEVPLTDEARAQARHFFGEELVSEARANPGKHRFIELLLNPHYVRVSGKDNPLRRLLLLVEEAWEKKSDPVLAPGQGSQYAEAVRTVLTHLDAGELRVAESGPDGWSPNGWLKKAILLSFRLNTNEIMDLESWDRAALGPWFDKVQNKFAGWNHDRFAQAGFRAVPGAIVRHGAFIGKNVVLMPSFVNIGAYVGEGTMVDTWATVGSCAQIGKNVHLSGGAGIGGVLEPLQANPTIIEDECFIGARSEVAEGVVVRKRAVLSMGVFIGKNTPIVDRTKGNAISRGEVPEGAVVMMGIHPENGLTCPQIVKYRDEKTDAATALNEMLRD